jgi:hypothetical protein
MQVEALANVITKNNIKQSALIKTSSNQLEPSPHTVRLFLVCAKGRRKLKMWC